MTAFRSDIVIFGRDRSGQSGHRVPIGFRLSRLFQRQSGQSGQTCFSKAQGVPNRENAALALTPCRPIPPTRLLRNMILWAV